MFAPANETKEGGNYETSINIIDHSGTLLM